MNERRANQESCKTGQEKRELPRGRPALILVCWPRSTNSSLFSRQFMSQQCCVLFTTFQQFSGIKKQTAEKKLYPFFAMSCLVQGGCGGHGSQLSVNQILQKSTYCTVIGPAVSWVADVYSIPELHIVCKKGNDQNPYRDGTLFETPSCYKQNDPLSTFFCWLS